MRLTDEQIADLRDDTKPGFYIPPWDIPLPATIHDLATEVLESRAAIADRDKALDAAIYALGEWARKAGTFEVCVAKLEGALRQAEDWFRAYGQGHDAKGDTDKAKRNHDRADYCARAALGRDET